MSDSKVAEACKKSIIEASGGALGEREATALLRENLKKVELAKAGEKLTAEMLRADATDASRSALFAALNEQRQKVINSSVKTKMLSSIRNNFGGDLFEGIVSWLGGSNKDAFGGRFSVDTKIKELRANYLGQLEGGLHKLGLTEVFANDSLQVEFAKALQVLETPGKRLEDLNVPVQAKQMAELVHGITKQFVERANRAGASIGKLEGFIMQQVHSPSELKRAAWDFRALNPKTWSEFRRPTDAENAKTWVDYIKGKLDLQKTFEGVPDKEIDAKLTEDWYTFVTGNKLKANGADDYAGFTGFKNVAKTISGSRSYHFKSAEDFVEYNTKFGTGSLKYSLVSRMDHMARNIGLMEGLGTNPKTMLDNVHKELLDDATRVKDVSLVKKLQTKKRFLDNILASLDGSVNVPNNVSVAQYSSYLRNLATISRLGFVTFRSFSDFATITSRLKLQGVDLSTGYSELLKGMFQFPKGQKREIAEMFNMANISFTGHLNRDWITDGAGPGTTSKVMDTFFRLSLLDRFDTANQSTIAWILSKDLGKNHATPFDGLHSELQKTLGQYGVKPEHWDLYREQHWDTEDGHRMLTPDRVVDIPEEKIIAALQKEGRNPTKNNIQGYRDDLQSRFSSYVVDTADFAVPKPGARVNALLNQGLLRGTAAGEAIRFFSQFKPFAVSTYQKALLPTLQSKNPLAIANYLAGTAIIGYISNDLIINPLMGKKPRSLFDPQTAPQVIADSMAKGGGLGIYADYVLGNFDKNRHPLLSALAGPVLGQLNDVGDIYTKMKEAAAGDEKADPLAAMVRMGQRNAPYQNLWFWKYALDRAIFWRWAEKLNPGSMRRMQENMEKTGTEFQDNAVFQPPSSVE